MNDTPKDTKNLKFYSQKAIGIATFLGGPLAAGYIVRENYLALDQPDEGKKALTIGILASVLIFTGLFMIPETIIDKIPNQIIPAVYVLIVYLLVEKYQGQVLRNHKENNYVFFSGWKAAGIGLISALIVGLIFFGVVYLSEASPELDAYEQKIAQFENNEVESLKFFDNAMIKSNFNLIRELDHDVIPKWEENLKLSEEINQIKGLPPEIYSQSELLIEYSRLRISVLNLIKKNLVENTNNYNGQIDSLNEEIEEVLNKLNEVSS